MSATERRTVGDRGQVTIPKELREAFGIEGGDEVVVHEESDKIVIEKPVSEADLAEGYQRRAERDDRLADEFAGVSREADAQLDEPPEW
jgi:AbrB family looped-hinge helix DNA binding protein